MNACIPPNSRLTMNATSPPLRSPTNRGRKMVNNIYRNLSKSVVSIFGQEAIKTAQLVADMTARKYA